jgi:hypothetical protein
MERAISLKNGYNPLPFGSLLLAGLFAGLGSTAANVLLATFASVIFPVPESFRPFTVFPILAASLGASLGAAALYSFFERISNRPKRSFKRAALLLLGLSFLLPASLVRPAAPGLSGIGWELTGTLMLMHSITALISVRALNRLSPPG